MKKGDIKKAELIQTAEQLFCRNGYEQTSVQEILDILNTSKGSFYHHFPSKEALLEAICCQRADAVAADTEKRMGEDGSILERLNTCLEGLIPLNGERITFLLMLLPVFDLPEGRSVKYAYQNSLTNVFHPMLTSVLEEGHRDGTLFCPHAAVQAQLTLLLLNNLWGSICEKIIQAEKMRESIDLSQNLEFLNQSRTAIEKIISAPFGSVKLLNMADLKNISDQIHLHWKTR